MSKQTLWCSCTFMMLVAFSFAPINMHAQCVSCCGGWQNYLPQIEANTKNTADNTQQMLTDITTIKDNSTAYNDSWFNYLENYLGLNFDSNHQPQTPLIPPTPGLDTTAGQTLNTQMDSAGFSASADVQTIIDKILTNAQDLETMMSTEFSNIPPNGGGTTAPSAFPSLPSPTTGGSNSLNIDTILGTNGIDGLNSADKGSELGHSAINLAKIITGAVSTHTIHQNQSDSGMENENWRKYLISIWSMSAKLSMALSNFYHMLRQREKVSGFGTVMGGGANDKFSPREVEEHLVNKRVGSATWYQEMEEASPIRLQRESVYILADISKLTLEMKKQDERSLATTSLILAQNVEFAKVMLRIMEDIEAAKKEAASYMNDSGEFEMPTPELPPGYDVPEY